MSERHIELTWHCAACKHENLGRHMQCEKCGKPKTDAEEYEMPSDTSSAASVEDESLLRMAKGGANWSCKYCGYDQRNAEGGCARCGAGRKQGEKARPQAMQAGRSQHRSSFGRTLLRDGRFWAAVMVIAFLGTCAVIVRKNNHARDERLSVQTMPTAVAYSSIRTDFGATVTSVSWQTKLEVQRWQLVKHAGFTADLPADAVDTKDAGVHFHHNEDVFDHDETVYDDVQVPDGTRTESYTEHVACGQNCTPSTRSCHQVCTQLPQSCHEVCTNSKNGFASCNNVCTGGGQSCHDECSGSDGHCETKYCDEPRTRQVPKTRTEKQPRTVHKYRSEPRNAPWSTYEEWEWAPLRDATLTGDDVNPTWGDAGTLQQPASGDAGAERFVKTETLKVNLALDDGSTRVYVPASDDELAQLTPNTKLRVNVNGSDVTISHDQ